MFIITAQHLLLFHYMCICILMQVRAWVAYMCLHMSVPVLLCRLYHSMIPYQEIHLVRAASPFLLQHPISHTHTNTQQWFYDTSGK